MKLYILFIVIIITITNCVTYSYQEDKKNVFSINDIKKQTYCNKNQIKEENIYDNYIYRYAAIYSVDAALIKAIIQVESNYDPSVVSTSNAIGLMQLKADTAGKDAYRLKGWSGKPSTHDLKNAIINIELGTAYLSILQKQLDGIINLETRRYALIVAYVNGLGALLKIFSIDRVCAIKKINNLDPKQFYQYIQHHHPSKQAQRYLFKVNAVYVLKNIIN